MQTDAKFTRTFYHRFFFSVEMLCIQGLFTHMLMLLMQQPSSTQAVKNRREWVGGEVLLLSAASYFKWIG